MADDVAENLPDGVCVRAYAAGRKGDRFGVAFLYDGRDVLLGAHGADAHDAVARLWKKAARVVRAVAAREAARLPKGGV